MYYIFISAFLYVLGDFVSKLYSLSNSKIQLGGAILLYFLGSIFMLLSIRENSLSVSVLIMPPLTILASVLVGRYYFNESLLSIQIIGAVLIFLGILFVLFGPMF